MKRPCSLSLLAAALGFSSLLASGCFTRSSEHYIPAADRALDALTQALTAWQNGQSPHLTDAATPIEVLDSRWKKGGKLAHFEVLGEEPADGHRWFKVKLTLQAPAGEKTVRYVVIGDNPLWVYSEEEYKAVSGM